MEKADARRRTIAAVSLNFSPINSSKLRGVDQLASKRWTETSNIITKKITARFLRVGVEVSD